MKKFFTLKLLILILCGFVANAQYQIKGKVLDDTNSPLIGATVQELGKNVGTFTDVDGQYSLSVSSETAQIEISFTGSEPQVFSANKIPSEVILKTGTTLLEVKVVGSRSRNRTATNTPVAVDIIDMSEVSLKTGFEDVDDILQYAAPSFNATKQSGSDGADHIIPATLRGLGPDQTLVLVNGKRRHQSSLINVFGTRGRGNTGTDLNAIPATAIKRIEVLRDGAAAQYGSDAIAGVINIVLKDNVDQFSGSVSYGGFSTNGASLNDFENAPSLADYFDANDSYFNNNIDGKNRLDDKDRTIDGLTTKIGMNYGLSLSDKGGYANITTEFVNKEKTLRPGFGFRKGYGSAGIESFNFLVNATLPINKTTEAYAFGGRNFRNTNANAFTRGAYGEDDRTGLPQYINGFTPQITSKIIDNSLSAGIRKTLDNGWMLDINNTYGKNYFHYKVINTNNASLEEASPTQFDAGGHFLSMNVTGIDMNKYFEKALGLTGINLAYGTEFRTENFGIFAGETGSYATYDTLGLPIISPSQVAPTGPSGGLRSGGSQGFPGYSPDNEVNEYRTNFALYADVEADITSKFLIGAALRFEHYSDFGNTFNYKITSKLDLSNNLLLRGSVSTGFRAPSLAQIYYNLKFTNFVGGNPEEVLLAANNTPITDAFGISKLKQETANNAAIGLAYQAGDFSASVDGYYIKVQDRIVLTEYFDASAFNIGVASAQFFANGVDTKTMGLDLVLNYNKKLNNNQRLNLGLTGNINHMEILEVNNGDLDASTFFGPREQAFLLASAPRYKFGLNGSYSVNKFTLSAAASLFSSIELLDWQMYEATSDYGTIEDQTAAATDLYESKTIFDLTANYKLTNGLTLSLGANNLFNVVPTIQDDWTDGGGYWDSVQMGTDGRYMFAKLNVNF